ncbi:MAG: metallophosphoesterase [Actinomycetota bacterium]|nr:metallophosphoesterase [Actinomycetota bacterium]
MPRLLTSRIRVIEAAFFVALAGAVLGVLLGGHTSHRVGPFESKFSLTPALRGDTEVEIPPLGGLRFDSHDGPVRLDVTLNRLRQADAQALLKDPEKLNDIGNQADHDVRAAVAVLVARTCLAGLIGAFILGLLVFRSWRRALITAGLAVVMVGATVGVAALTFNPQSLREPRYSGLLTNAPALIGDAQDFADRFGVYQQELAGLVTNVSRLYTAASTLSAYQPDTQTIRVLHVSDIHLNPAAWDVIRSIVRQYQIGVVVDSGDLTDHGSAPEAAFADAISTLGVPYVSVRGNHDSTDTMLGVAKQKGAVVLDGTEREVAGITFAGIGDPRFTPDRTTRDKPKVDLDVLDSGKRLAAAVPTFARPPDVLVVHDPAAAEPLAGVAPLVLAGHLHKRESRHLGKTTLLLVEGSTGGAGLRGLENDKPTPLEASVLYFDATTHALRAYDTITLGGLGESTVTIERTVLKPLPAPEPSPSG